MNLSEAIDCMGRVSAAFPRAALSEPTLRLWAADLLDFEAGDILEAARLIARQDGRISLDQLIREARRQITNRLQREREAREQKMLAAGGSRSEEQLLDLHIRTGIIQDVLDKKIGRDMLPDSPLRFECEVDLRKEKFANGKKVTLGMRGNK